MSQRFTPEAASAARWLGVKVAVIRHTPRGIRVQSPTKPGRFATFYGEHPRPADFLGSTWWLLEQQEVEA